MSDAIPTSDEARIDRWRYDPVQFVHEALGVPLEWDPKTKTGIEPWQRKALDGMARGNRLAMKACKGPGKTTVLAWLVYWFLSTRYRPKVICTSVSGDNLSDGLWTELAKWRGKSPFLQAMFVWSSSAVRSREVPEEHYAVARTWAKDADSAAQADTLAGKHADSMLFVIDECGAIPVSVMAAGDAALAGGGDQKMAIAGNPTQRDGILYWACMEQREYWQVVEISSAPGDPERSQRVDKKWAEDQIRMHGETNPWVLANIFGRFPPTGADNLLGTEQVTDAMKRVYKPELLIGHARVLGLDCAGRGDDRQVLFPRQGPCAMRPLVMRNMEPVDVAARVIRVFHKWDADAVIYDDTGGYGMAVAEYLKKANIPAIGINFSSKATDDRYLNKRAEMWWLMCEDIKAQLLLPNEPDLIKELTVPRYEYDKNRFKIEDKKEVKKRLGRSPDLADSLAITYSIPIIARSRHDKDRTDLDEHFSGQEHGASHLKSVQGTGRCKITED